MEWHKNVVEGTCSDENGDTIGLKIYYYKEEPEDNYKSYFKKGAVIYLKEQFHKIQVTMRDYIRVDDPKCLEF